MPLVLNIRLLSQCLRLITVFTNRWDSDCSVHITYYRRGLNLCIRNSQSQIPILMIAINKACKHMTVTEVNIKYGLVKMWLPL